MELDLRSVPPYCNDPRAVVALRSIRQHTHSSPLLSSLPGLKVGRRIQYAAHVRSKTLSTVVASRIRYTCHTDRAAVQINALAADSSRSLVPSRVLQSVAAVDISSASFPARSTTRRPP
nr:hypothetical protein CFP56_12029 [Quercus suber]